MRNALAILDHLLEVKNSPCTVSEIARATSINLSTCFNVLKTLEDGRVVSFDPATKAYRLGPYLGALGNLVSADREGVRLALAEARTVTGSTGLGCFVMTFTDREDFVVLDKVESPDPIRVTIDIGARFPPGGAVAAKAWLAWAPTAVVDDHLERHRLPLSTARSIVDPGPFRDELARTRHRGYAASLSEYYPDHNAVAAPVFGWDGLPRFLLVVVGTLSQLPEEKIPAAGKAVAQAAARATAGLAGRPSVAL